MIDLVVLKEAGYVLIEKRFRKRSIIISEQSSVEDGGVFRIVRSSDPRYHEGQYPVLDKVRMHYGTAISDPLEEGMVYEIIHSDVIIGLYDKESAIYFDKTFTESFKSIFEKRTNTIVKPIAKA